MAKSSSKSSFFQTILSFWSGRSPVLKFVLGFMGLMVLFYLVFSTAFYLHYIFEPVVKADAFLGSMLLNLFGQGTHVEGSTILSPAFSIGINLGCDGLEAMALFVAAIIAYPVSFSKKYKGILGGLVFLFILNLIRIVSLFLTGKYFPDAFEFMHLEFWQALFLILTVAAWLVWVRKTRVVSRNVNKDNHA